MTSPLRQTTALPLQRMAFSYFSLKSSRRRNRLAGFVLFGCFLCNPQALAVFRGPRPTFFAFTAYFIKKKLAKGNIMIYSNKQVVNDHLLFMILL